MGQAWYGAGWHTRLRRCAHREMNQTQCIMLFMLLLFVHLFDHAVADAGGDQVIRAGESKELHCMTMSKPNLKIIVPAADSYSPLGSLRLLWSVHALSVTGDASVYVPSANAPYSLLQGVTSIAKPRNGSEAIASPASPLAAHVSCRHDFSAIAEERWLPKRRLLSFLLGMLLVGFSQAFVQSRAFKPTVYILALIIALGMAMHQISCYFGLTTRNRHRGSILSFVSPYAFLWSFYYKGGWLCRQVIELENRMITLAVLCIILVLIGVYVWLAIFITNTFLLDPKEYPNGVSQSLRVATCIVCQSAGIIAFANGNEDRRIQVVSLRIHVCS